ncbi:glycoside hydrolase family 15 protein [Amaricoccus solimangrovi]|uniref:Trehalase n=1 Tax=Amaricoccus solimangrovi TaxID=2589815 RepID=A0A501WX25_9RHOB|nr:glycoside hydrolase family 15 protein [Amaricoccus solimangrovi]TPE52704.1 glycoside hydrolase family 15 protein [Amaricoccus solimangrovi]
MSAPIESYGMIGDCRTAALVGRDGSIDWLCLPRFDSDSVFAALVGGPENGRWLIGPRDGGEAASRRYLDGSPILETRFETEEGVVELIDFMPPGAAGCDLTRLLRGRRGRVRMRMELSLRFDYGKIVPWVRRAEVAGRRVLLAIGGPHMTVLSTAVETRGENERTIAEFEVGEGEEIPFTLSYAPSYQEVPAPADPREALRATEAFWRDWSSRCEAAGKVRKALGERAGEAVTRSLVTLKALTYAPTGGIVAAPTTSLPEAIGGARNWDYRYCWLRDATLTLIALMDGGYYDEARAWRDWLLRAAAGRPDQLSIMYGLAGERRLREWEAPWLAGYAGSRPVRIGNAAHAQLQLDVFGEVMDALHQARAGGLPESEPGWALQSAMIAHLEKIWRQPDAGLWEIRSERRQFTYSKAMAWVAVDRCIRSVENFGLPGPVEHWRRLRDTIHADVCRRGFDSARNCFVQVYGGQELDASLLLLPALGFLPASDPRFRGTVAAIERELMVDGLVRRYDTQETDDGVAGREGVFLACSFWLADAYGMLGRRRKARALFERLLDLRNDLGLLAEEYDPEAGRQLGNFPQAFSHVALVTSAIRLANEAGAEERSPSAAPAEA